MHFYSGPPKQFLSGVDTQGTDWLISTPVDWLVAQSA
jgi:hypothetical protein